MEFRWDKGKTYVYKREDVYAKNKLYIAACLSLSLVAGCSGPIIQEGDMILDERVTVIDDPSQDIIVAELPNLTILVLRTIPVGSLH